MLDLSFIVLLIFADGKAIDQPVTPSVEFIEPTQTLRIRARSSALFRSKRPLLRMSIPHPDKVSVIQYSPTLFELLGHRTGETILTIWFAPDGDREAQIVRYLVTIARD
jgi:hypothetical protein